MSAKIAIVKQLSATQKIPKVFFAHDRQQAIIHIF